MNSSAKAIRIGRNDSVGVALVPLKAGSRVLDVRLNMDIPAGHKFALTDLSAGTPVLKYGMPIGHASRSICAGDWIHSHNLKTGLSGEEHYDWNPVSISSVDESWKNRSFSGFARPDGQCGIRNELWIIPTVGCVNALAENIAKLHAKKTLPSTVNGVFAFPHPYGCSQLGEDHETTAELLASLVRHPNAGGVLVVALGCENNTLEEFKRRVSGCDPRKVRFLKAQDDGDELASGLALLDELSEYAGSFSRSPQPVSRLCVGLKCGGSDGLSGITANPLIGRFSDLLNGAGGATVLSEVPEMFGAERILMNRCKDENIFRQCVEMVNGFKQYFLQHGQPVYENPSPGNKEGGITTLEEKSLGCIQKGGEGAVCDVLKYGERRHCSGLNLLSGPGNDMVAVTALAVAGSQMVLFSTGRGTPFGGPVPTLKIATNTALAKRKPGWIDFNAGALADGSSTLDESAVELFELVLRTASGDFFAGNEISGFREIAIFKTGVTL